MSRTIVDIPDALLAQVDALCKMLSISRAEATRQALKVFVRSHHNVNVDAFGLWAASKPGNHARKTDSKNE